MIPGNEREEWLAAAVFEALSDEEQPVFDAMLVEDEGFRKEYDVLRSVRAAVPNEPIPFQGDLRGVVLEELRRNGGRQRGFNWTLVGVLGMALLIIGAVSLQFFPLVEPKDLPVTIASAELQSGVQNLIATAQEEVLQGNYSQALEILTTGLEQTTVPAESGQLQLALANTEFAHGERYAQAYAAYEDLRNQHFDVFSADPATVQRFEVLAENAGDDFAPIYAYDVARNGGLNGITGLENLVASHPDKRIAQLAILAMEEEIVKSLPDESTRVAALEAVRDRCANASARARLELAIGEAHLSEGKDTDSAVRSFQQALACDNPVVAQLAEKRLASLR